MPHNFSNAELEWDDDNKPHSSLYHDIYFSTADAAGEAEYVFLEKNNLKQRWSTTSCQNFVVAECGFGSGLNFLSACKLWCETAPINCSLHYIACEKHPLHKEDLIRLHSQWPHLKNISDALLKNYPDHTAGIHRLHFNIASRDITLDLLYGDACVSLNTIYQTQGAKVNAWFLDGFSPKLNPQMWSQDLFQAIARLSKNGTTLSTYSVAGDIRRGLATLGFEVSKAEGYGRKRHMLCATFNTSNASQEAVKAFSNSPAYSPAYFTLPASTRPQEKTVTIIGAGLAGCSSAYALAKKDWQVTLIEREPSIASMASANPQGIVHCKLSKQLNPTSRFSQQAYLYAIRQYQALSQTHDFHWQQCGMLQLAYNAGEAKRQQDILDRDLYSSQLFQALSPQQSSDIASLPLSMGGLFFPAAGWLNPKLLCQAYCQHPNINVHLHTQAIELIQDKQQWQLNDNNKHLASSAIVIIANSLDANKLSAAAHYPLIPNRGQVDFYKTTETSRALKTVLCSNAYIIPASNGLHSIGGSFTPNSIDSSILDSDRQNNLISLEKCLPDIYTELCSQQAPTSRAAVRCSTPDYLPIVGPVEDYAASQALYAELSLNAKKECTSSPAYKAGLFVNIAHGSHGLTTIPLASEYLAALINAEPLPLQNEIIDCLHPIRFLIRDLKRQSLR